MTIMRQHHRSLKRSPESHKRQARNWGYPGNPFKNQRLQTSLRFITIVMVFALLAALMSAPPLRAESEKTPPNVILILDGSGSMWGKIADGHKVLIAREVITNSFRPLNNRINLGFMAYGHRRRGACRDIEILQSISPLNTTRFTRLVNRVKPLGKTPIANALDQAAKQLIKTKSGGHIILLTDGPENCRRDPCAIIPKGFADQHKITVHVLAFAMGERDARTLQCLADSSGGKFLIAEDKAGLQLALNSALGATLKGYKGPVATREIQPERVQPQLKLTAHLGKNTSPLEKDLSWEISKLNENNEESDPDLPPWLSQKTNPTFDLDPGAYRVTATYKDYQISNRLRLEKGETKLEKIIFNLTELVLPSGWARANSRSGFGKLLLEPEKKSQNNIPPRLIDLTSENQTLLIKAGAYKLTGIENGKLQTWFFHAKPGKLTELPIWKNTGRLKLTLKDGKTGEWLGAPLVLIQKLNNQGEPTRELARSTAQNPQFDLASGQYQINLEEGFVKKTIRTTITQDQTTELEILLERASFELKVNQENEDAPITVSLFQTGNGQKTFIGTTGELKKSIIVKPGTYRLEVHKSGETISIFKAVKLKPGQRKVIKINPRTTEVQFTISNRNDPLSRHQIFWQLFEKDGNLIWQSTRPTPAIKLPRGAYIVKAEIGKDRYTHRFRIRGNRPEVIDLAKALQN